MGSCCCCVSSSSLLSNLSSFCAGLISFGSRGEEAAIGDGSLFPSSPSTIATAFCCCGSPSDSSSWEELATADFELRSLCNQLPVRDLPPLTTLPPPPSSPPLLSPPPSLTKPGTLAEELLSSPSLPRLSTNFGSSEARLSSVARRGTVAAAASSVVRDFPNCLSLLSVVFPPLPLRRLSKELARASFARSSFERRTGFTGSWFLHWRSSEVAEFVMG